MAMCDAWDPTHPTLENGQTNPFFTPRDTAAKIDGSDRVESGKPLRFKGLAVKSSRNRALKRLLAPLANVQRLMIFILILAMGIAGVFEFRDYRRLRESHRRNAGLCSHLARDYQKRVTNPAFSLPRLDPYYRERLAIWQRRQQFYETAMRWPWRKIPEEFRFDPAEATNEWSLIRFHADDY